MNPSNTYYEWSSYYKRMLHTKILLLEFDNHFHIENQKRNLSKYEKLTQKQKLLVYNFYAVNPFHIK